MRNWDTGIVCKLYLDLLSKILLLWFRRDIKEKKKKREIGAKLVNAVDADDYKM